MDEDKAELIASAVILGAVIVAILSAVFVLVAVGIWLIGHA